MLEARTNASEPQTKTEKLTYKISKSYFILPKKITKTTKLMKNCGKFYWKKLIRMEMEK